MCHRNSDPKVLNMCHRKSDPKVLNMYHRKVIRMN